MNKFPFHQKNSIFFSKFFPQFIYYLVNMNVVWLYLLKRKVDFFYFEILFFRFEICLRWILTISFSNSNIDLFTFGLFEICKSCFFFSDKLKFHNDERIIKEDLKRFNSMTDLDFLRRFRLLLVEKCKNDWFLYVSLGRRMNLSHCLINTFFFTKTMKREILPN